MNICGQIALGVLAAASCATSSRANSEFEACTHFLFEELSKESDLFNGAVMREASVVPTSSLPRYRRVLWSDVTFTLMNFDWRAASDQKDYAISVSCLVDVVDHRVLEINVEDSSRIGSQVEGETQIEGSKTYLGFGGRLFAVGNQIHKGRY